VAKQVEGNNHSEEVQFTRINDCQSNSMSENTLSSSDVRTAHMNEPLSKGFSSNGSNEVTAERGQICCPQNNVSNQENVWNGNSVGFVREIPNHPIDLALPIIQNKPDQNPPGPFESPRRIPADKEYSSIDSRGYSTTVFEGHFSYDGPVGISKERTCVRPIEETRGETGATREKRLAPMEPSSRGESSGCELPLVGREQRRHS
jgi:hypothetical protein